MDIDGEEQEDGVKKVRAVEEAKENQNTFEKIAGADWSCGTQ